MSTYYQPWIDWLRQLDTIWATLTFVSVLLALPWPLSARIKNIKYQQAFRWFHLCWLAVLAGLIVWGGKL